MYLKKIFKMFLLVQKLFRRFYHFTRVSRKLIPSFISSGCNGC